MNRISPSAAPAIRDFRIHLGWLPERFATLFGLKDGARANVCFWPKAVVDC